MMQADLAIPVAVVFGLWPLGLALCWAAAWLDQRLNPGG